MRQFRSFFAFCASLWLAPLLSVPACAARQASQPQMRKAETQWLFMEANTSRAAAGAGPLAWDDSLAAAALQHCLRMAVEGPIAHRYPGEAELTERTSAEGAHFSLIEENIAVGSYITTIHQGWLDSPEHRANLLNPQIDRVGIAVVASHGVFFAVADYARTVPVLTSVQVEASFANLIHTYGIAIHRDPSDAHAVCALDAGLPPSVDPRPRYILRWQGAELNRLPQELKDLLASKRYRSAAVGNCSLKNKDEGFTVYRMAVLLY